MLTKKPAKQKNETIAKPNRDDFTERYGDDNRAEDSERYKSNDFTYQYYYNTDINDYYELLYENPLAENMENKQETEKYLYFLKINFNNAKHLTKKKPIDPPGVPKPIDPPGVPIKYRRIHAIRDHEDPGDPTKLTVFWECHRCFHLNNQKHKFCVNKVPNNIYEYFNPNFTRPAGDKKHCLAIFSDGGPVNNTEPLQNLVNEISKIAKQKIKEIKEIKDIKYKNQKKIVNRFIRLNKNKPDGFSSYKDNLASFIKSQEAAAALLATQNDNEHAVVHRRPKPTPKKAKDATAPQSN